MVQPEWKIYDLPTMMLLLFFFYETQTIYFATEKMQLWHRLFIFTDQINWLFYIISQDPTNHDMYVIQMLNNREW